MALDMFAVSHDTDGPTRRRIVVEPRERRCGITITVDGRIVRIADETDPTCRSYTPADWGSVEHWERRAHELARAYSPFWNPKGDA